MTAWRMALSTAPDGAGAARAERVSWWLVGLGAVALGAIAGPAGFSIDLLDLLPVFGFALVLGPIAIALRGRGWRRVASLGSAVALTAIAAGIAMLTSVVLARSGLPLRDAELLAIDRAIGFDTLALVDRMPRWPLSTLALNYAYASMHYQLLAALVLLALAGNERRLQLFVLAWLVALWGTVALFPLVPALGWYLHLGVTREMVPQVLVPAAWLYVDVLDGARSGTLTVLGRGSLDGVITFPSFHAAAAVLLAWAFRPLPVLGWCALGLNGVMLASTVVIGGHYIVDVVAGSLVAAASLGIALRIAERTRPTRAEDRPPLPVGRGRKVLAGA